MKPTECFPKPQSLLLLKAALAVKPGASFWWGQYWAQGMLAEHGYLLGWVYQRLNQEGFRGAGMVPLKQAYLASWGRQMEMEKLARQALDDLQAAGVRPVLIKGLAVGCWLKLASHRSMADFDVLIAPHELDQAASCLEQQGWSQRQPIPGRDRRAILHGMSWSKDGHCLDLHWFIMPECLDSAQDDECRARVQTLQLRGQPCLALDPTDLLLHALVHGCKCGSSDGWVVDSSLLLQRAEVDWNRLLEQAGRRRVVSQCRATLLFLARELQAPVPATVLQSLAQPSLSRLDWLYFQVKTRRRRWWSWLAWPLLDYLRLPENQKAVGFWMYLRRRWGVHGSLIPELARRVLRFLRSG